MDLVFPTEEHLNGHCTESSHGNIVRRLWERSIKSHSRKLWLTQAWWYTFATSTLTGGGRRVKSETLSQNKNTENLKKLIQVKEGKT